MDYSKLQKVVDYSLSLPDFNDDYLSPAEATEPVWYQGDWFRAYYNEGGYNVQAGESELTDAGVVTTVGETVYKCNTTACIAGNTAVLFAPNGTKFDNQGRIKLPGSDWQDIMFWAQQELNLTPGEAFDLFRASNNDEEIREITARITGE